VAWDYFFHLLAINLGTWRNFFSLTTFPLLKRSFHPHLLSFLNRQWHEIISSICWPFMLALGAISSLWPRSLCLRDLFIRTSTF
jgi:hypothetical protein